MKLEKTSKLAITIRGHVRDSLNDNLLYDFLRKITQLYDIDIYIYTFDIKSSGKIYTKENKEIDKSKITEKNILDYLKDLSIYTKKIIIDEKNSAPEINDRKIHNVSKNKFLHMWNSIYNSIKCVKESNITYDYIVNMRIDYFQLMQKFKDINYVSFMNKLFKINIYTFFEKIDLNENICFSNIVETNKIKKNFRINEFFKKKREQKKEEILKNIIYDENDILYGIDNIFAGKLDYLYKLSLVFTNNMDDVFDFLEIIFDDLGKYSKMNGGSGAPHEVILPLFVKNKFNHYLDNHKFE